MTETGTPKVASFAEFARLLGVSRSYIAKLRDHGRLFLSDDGKRVMVAASRRRIAQTESGRRPDVKERHAGQRGAELPPPPEATSGESPPPGPDDDAPAVGSRAYWERIDREEIARMRQLDRRKMEKELVERDDVDFVLNDFGATLRGLLENLPDRLAPQVYPLTTLEETHAVLSEAVENLQREMAESMKRRMEGMGQ